MSLLPHQVMPQTPNLTVLRIDQLLNVAFEMSPTPLKAFAVEVHLGSVAIQDDSRIITDQRHERLPRAIAKDAEDGKHRRDGDPQPSFHLFLFGWRFVHKELRLLIEFAAKLFVRSGDRVADEILNFHGPGRTTGDVQQIPEEHRRPAFALTKVPHQQAGKRGQSAWVVIPQQGQWPRKSWYSSTTGSIGGKSHTW